MFLRSVCVLVVGILLAAERGSANAPEAAPAPRRLDSSGDPLPEGAVARLGSARFRHPGLADFVLLHDGRAVTAGTDRVVRFWDTATGRQTRAVVLPAEVTRVRLLKLSPDGRLLAAFGRESLAVWDTAAGRVLRRIDPPEGGVDSLAFSPDGELLVAASASGLTLLRWRDGTPVRAPLPEPDTWSPPPTRVAFSADGRRLMVRGALGEARLQVYDLAGLREVYSTDAAHTAAAVSPDGRRLALCEWSGPRGEQSAVLRLIDLASGDESARFPLDDAGRCESVAFGPDGRTLACAGASRCCVIDAGTGRVLLRLAGRAPGVTFSPDGRTLAAAAGHRLQLWDARTGRESSAGPDGFEDRPILTATPDGRLVASEDPSGWAVAVWDTATGRLARRLELKPEDGFVRSLAFAADGRTLTAGLGRGRVVSWDVTDGRVTRDARLRGRGRPGGDYFSYLEVSPGGRLVASLDPGVWGRDDRGLGVWDAATGRPLGRHPLPPGRGGFAWSADGATVVVTTSDGVTVLAAGSGRTRLRVPDGGPVALGPDGRLAAVQRPADGPGDAATVGVYELATGAEVASVPTGPVGWLALAPAGRALVTADDRAVRVWDLATGRERGHRELPPDLGSGPGGSGPVTGLVVSWDGRRATTTLADRTALVWDLAAFRPGRLVPAGGGRAAAWWDDLAGPDAAKACQAMWRLAELPPGEVVPFLRARLKPAAAPDPVAVRRLVGELDSADFAAREAASRGLERLGGAAAPALRRVLEGNVSAEVRRRLEAVLARFSDPPLSAEGLRFARAVGVLEQLGTIDARRLLEDLARGADGAPETRTARDALERAARGADQP